jgi:hypothetical protein
VGGLMPECCPTGCACSSSLPFLEVSHCHRPNSFLVEFEGKFYPNGICDPECICKDTREPLPYWKNGHETHDCGLSFNPLEIPLTDPTSSSGSPPEGGRVRGQCGDLSTTRIFKPTSSNTSMTSDR